MAETNLLIRNLSASKFQKQVIENLNFDLNVGEIHTVVGSTASDVDDFLNVLEGNNPDITGEIQVKNRIYNAGDISKWRKEIAHIRQSNILLENLSIVDNLFFVHKISFAFSKSKIIASCKELLQNFDVHIDVNTKIENLTHQQKNIIEMVRLYLDSSDIIVLHQTLNYMDYEYFFKLQKIVSVLKNEGKSIIYVTSRFEDIFKMSDRISFLSNGQIISTFDAEEVKRNPRKTMYLMSGWENGLNPENSNEEIHDIISSIFKGTEILTSSNELKDVLHFIADNLVKNVNAKSCIIYLIDEGANNIIDSVDPEDSETLGSRLKISFVESIAKRNSADLFFASCSDPDFQEYFRENNSIKTFIGIPVLLRSHTMGLIQVSYDNHYIYTDKDLMYFSTTKNEAALAIENSRLMGRSAMLKESHHRIKNNLQIIISLLCMQKEFQQGNQKQNLNDIINAVIYRIKSIAVVHDILSNEKMKSSIVNMKIIVGEVVKLYKSPDITIHMEMNDVFMPYNKASSIALVINELLSNCIKHAFEGKLQGAIDVICKNSSHQILLSINDNGVGISPGETTKDSGLGINIVKSIIQSDFGGEIEFLADKGTKVNIILPMSTFFDNVSA